MNADKWAQWQNAIACFNAANTDEQESMPQVEWVLLCGAFQSLLGAKSDALQVATNFV